MDIQKNYKEGIYVPEYNCHYIGKKNGAPYFLDYDKQEYVAVNHAVAIVGYGFDEKENMDYWIVKNSWGSEWGEDGYMKIAAGKNYCGIETYISFIENNF